jgi:hypothetical protein
MGAVGLGAAVALGAAFTALRQPIEAGGRTAADMAKNLATKRFFR